MAHVLPLEHNLLWFMCKDSQYISEIKQSFFLDTLEHFLSLNENYIIYYIFLFCLVSNAAVPLSLDFSALLTLLLPPFSFPCCTGFYSFTNVLMNLCFKIFIYCFLQTFITFKMNNF